MEKLHKKNNYLRLPSGMEFSIEDKVLTIGMKEKGLTSNMQTDASAFEGWAICLKAWLPEMIDKVIINGEIPTEKTKKHYQRFLYRLHKFIHNYSAWASTESYKDELHAFEFNVSHIVMNVTIKNGQINC